MMDMIVTSMYLLYKKPLETCLDCLKRLQERIGVREGLTYAGRLDPLASGLLIALDSTEIAKKQEILGLSKVYECEVVFGIGTDSFDQLGCIYPSNEIMSWKTLNFPQEKIKEIIPQLQKEFEKGIEGNIQIINAYLKKLAGEVELFYPFFSSKTIDGIPLFQYAKDNGIEKTNALLPTRKAELIDITCLSISEISYSDLAQESITIAQKVQGDFRQNEIIDSWQTHRIELEKLPIWSLRISCGSGFYVRTLAVWLGQILGMPAIARNIKRIKVGEFDIEEGEIFS